MTLGNGMTPEILWRERMKNTRKKEKEIDTYMLHAMYLLFRCIEPLKVINEDMIMQDGFHLHKFSSTVIRYKGPVEWLGKLDAQHVLSSGHPLLYNIMFILQLIFLYLGKCTCCYCAFPNLVYIMHLLWEKGVEI